MRIHGRLLRTPFETAQRTYLETVTRGHLYAFAAAMFGAGCLSIAGLDGDYIAGERGGAPATGGSQTVGSVGGSAGEAGRASAGGGGMGGATTTTTVGGGGSGGCPGTHEYVAVVADCIDLYAPNPDFCEETAGVGEFEIDSLLSTTNSPRHGFLRFDLDPAVLARPITSIQLRLVVSMLPSAESDETGEIWRVVPFVRSDLFAGDVANVGSMASATDMGGVVLGQVVDWSLPTDIVDGESVYLAVRPVSSDLTGYVNLNGALADAPRLFITCR
jgi:hypothetical protein